MFLRMYPGSLLRAARLSSPRRDGSQPTGDGDRGVRGLRVDVAVAAVVVMVVVVAVAVVAVVVGRAVCCVSTPTDSPSRRAGGADGAWRSGAGG